MKILQINPDFLPFVRGGGTEVFRSLAQSWTDQGDTVTVLSSVPSRQLGKGFQSKDPYETVFFRLYNAPKRFHEASYYLPLTFKSFLTFRKWIINNASFYDLIVIHGILESLPLVSIITLPKNLRKKLILTHHGIPLAQNSKFLHSISKLLYITIGRIVLSRVDNIFVFSKQSYNDLLNYCGPQLESRVKSLDIGIDTRSLVNLRETISSEREKLKNAIKDDYGVGSPYIYSIGRIAKTKGFDILIKAFSKLILKAENIDLKLVISGDSSPYLEELKSLIKDLKIEGKIVFTGRVTEKEKLFLMLQCETFVIPSRREGFGLNSIEAAIFGVNTVATDTGAHKDVLENIDNCKIVVPENIEALYSAIDSLLYLPKEKESLLMEYVEKYDINKTAMAYKESL